MRLYGILPNLFCQTVQKREMTPLLLTRGARYAINFESGLQIVPGIAFPIGLGSSEDEYGVFVYLSFEHPLF